MKGILVLCLGLLNLTLLGQSGFIEESLEKWENSKEYTIEVAEAMPEEAYDYKPTEDQMSFKEQLLHMMGNINWLSITYLPGESAGFDLKSTEYSKQEIIGMLRKTYEMAGKAIEKMDVEQLDEKVEFFAGPKTKRQIMTLLNDHSTHHRGQIIIYLRMKGINPPRYRGW